jgi:hypothetical protein
MDATDKNELIFRFSVLGFIPMEYVEQLAAMVEQASDEGQVIGPFFPLLDQVCPLLDLETGRAFFSRIMHGGNEKAKTSLFHSKSVHDWTKKYSAELMHYFR